MTPIHPDLLMILDAVEVLSPTRYVLRGEPRDLTPSDSAGATITGPEAGDPPLVSALEDDLYERFYTRPVAPGALPPADELARRDLLSALSVANRGRGTWEPGWTIHHLDEGGRVAVAKDDVTFWVPPTGLKVREGAIRPGAACRVRVAKELRNLVPGYYVAIGDGEEDGEPENQVRVEPLVRYYWHLTPGAAAPFIDAATTLLNATGVPFRAKVLSDPHGYRRADAGVIYLDRRYVARLGDAIARIHDAVALRLRPDVPLLTRRLAEGLGLAEDPADGSSFGQHRCRLVARALWRGFERGDSGTDGRASTLAATFREVGLDPVRPHLQPGSRDDYSLRPTPPEPRCRARSARGRRTQPS